MFRQVRCFGTRLQIAGQGADNIESNDDDSTSGVELLVTSTNPTFQRINRSTELANAPQVTTTAWDTITKDASLSEFARLVKSAGLEGSFSRTDGMQTYLIPTNDAFSVLSQNQLARMEEPRFKDQAAAIVRHHIVSGRFTFADFTRRLPTGLPAAQPPAQTTCSTSEAC